MQTCEVILSRFQAIIEQRGQGKHQACIWAFKQPTLNSALIKGLMLRARAAASTGRFARKESTMNFA